MDIERAKRYKDKLNFILEKVNDIEEWTSVDISDFISGEVMDKWLEKML